MPSTTVDTYLLLRAFVDELVRCGVTDAITSPGSRNTPLLLSLVRDGRLRCTSQLDERVAGFHALGLAKATQRPVVLACTSGTAAANYAPAVIEAHEAGVPLLVLTADRPPELREAGAGQAIDQLKLYGGAVRWFFEVGTGHEATIERLRWMRSLACRAAWASEDRRPGPVHLNFPLREPLVLDAPLGDDPLPGRPDGRTWLDRPPAAAASSAAALAEALQSAQRPLIVAGRSERDPGLGAALASFAAALGAPLLADPLSGARRGRAAIAHYDALLRSARDLEPDLVVRVGDLPTSKPLRAWLASLEGVPQLGFQAESVWHDPAGLLDAVLPGDPRATLAALEPAPVDPSWLSAWTSADVSAAAAIEAALGAGLSEPRVARELVVSLDSEATLVVASSMPVRDLETFAPARDDPPRVLANRGANGIDGTVSTAIGVADAGRPTVLLTGDVALVHDAGGLLSLARTERDLVVVVLDNRGGGIFEFLPVAGESDAFEEHVATPPGVDVAGLAGAAGVPYVPIETVDELRAAVTGGGPALVHVHTNRAENLALHRRVWDAVASAG